MLSSSERSYSVNYYKFFENKCWILHASAGTNETIGFIGKTNLSIESKLYQCRKLYFFLQLLSEAFDVSVDVQLNPNNETNSEESEIETDFDFKNKTVPPKRMNLGAKSNHVRRKTLLQKYSVTIPTKSCPKEPKLDSFKILPNRKKIQILYSKVSTNHIVEIGKASKEEPFTILTDEVIINTRLTKDQFSIWPIFNDYEAGIKSNKLYVKNLANNVTESDLKSIFHRHILDSTDEIDIKLFRQGFLKGQCFVTFKLFENTLKRREAEKLIEKARKEAHGFILKNKPMYVVYGRYRKPLKITV